MSKKFEDDFDIDSIVIKDVDVQEIEERKYALGKEEDLFGEASGKKSEKKPEKDSEQSEEASEQPEEVSEQPEEFDEQLEEVDKQLENEEEEQEQEAAEVDEQLAEASRKLEGTEAEDFQAEEAVSDSEAAVLDDPDSGDSDLSYGEDADEEEDDDALYEDEVRPKRTKGDIIRYCVMFVALCVLVYSVFSLVTIFMEYKVGENEYDTNREKYSHTTEDPNSTQIPEYIDESDPLNPNFQIASIDWAGLKEENSDICAWIQFETLDQINYAVVQGTDDSYYLKHTINHTQNSAGSIFIEAQNKNDFSDMNTIIYGHNMKNGSMFGLLRYYKEASYYAGNEYFWIYTPQGNFRYKIFSCYEPMAVSETYSWWDSPCDEYTDYLSKIQSYSKYSTGVSVGPKDKIVTLSTCTSRGSDYRFVVHGKLVYSSVKKQTGQ